MVSKSHNGILYYVLFSCLIYTSNQLNLVNFLSRRNFLKVSMSTFGQNNFNTNKIFLSDSQNRDDVDILSENRKSNTLNNNIYFTGGLNEETCFQLTQTLISYKNMALTNQDYPNHINLYIQSPGGSLLPTLAVVDEIKKLGIPVHTYIRGYAASAATLLSVVGSQRYIYNHSLLMIHGIKFNEQTVSTLLDVKDLNTNVDILMDTIKNIYIENSIIDEDILNYLFYHDIWMNSSLALGYGLVDEIL